MENAHTPADMIGNLIAGLAAWCRTRTGVICALPRYLYFLSTEHILGGAFQICRVTLGMIGPTIR
jgi:hypothetical protein